jgi:hypothetical protein
MIKAGSIMTFYSLYGASFILTTPHRTPKTAPIHHSTLLVWNLDNIDNPNTTQTLEYTKGKYNAEIRKQKSLS